MLKVAAYLGYQVLILGAFGCGAFGNDAHVVSDLFYKALKEFNFSGWEALLGNTPYYLAFQGRYRFYR